MSANLSSFLDLIEQRAEERASGEVSMQTRQEIEAYFKAAVAEVLTEISRDVANRRR